MAFSPPLPTPKPRSWKTDLPTGTEGGEEKQTNRESDGRVNTTGSELQYLWLCILLLSNAAVLIGTELSQTQQPALLNLTPKQQTLTLSACTRSRPHTPALTRSRRGREVKKDGDEERKLEKTQTYCRIYQLIRWWLHLMATFVTFTPLTASSPCLNDCSNSIGPTSTYIMACSIHSSIHFLKHQVLKCFEPQSTTMRGDGIHLFSKTMIIMCLKALAILFPI